MVNDMRYLNSYVDQGEASGTWRRTRLLALLMIVALGASTVPAAADATISIDATSTFPQNGGDVLPTLKNIFQDGNAPGAVSGGPDTLADQMLPMLSGIGVKRARLLLVDEYCDIDVQGHFGTNSGGTFTAGDCFPLAWQIEWLIKANLSPHMAVASHMPTSFVQYGPAETWGDRRLNPSDPNGQKIIDHYKDYAKALVRYIATKAFTAGAQTAIFEVSNEMDIAADYPTCNRSNQAAPVCTLAPLGPWGRWLWWIDPNGYDIGGFSQAYAIADEDNRQLGFPYNGDVRRLGRGLLPVQKIFAEAVTSMNAEFAQNSLYSGKTIEMAGPALAGWNLIVRPQGTGASLEEQFLEQTFNPYAAPYGGKFNAPLNRFSFHYYGSVEALRTTTADHACDADVTEPFNLFRQMTGAYRTKLGALRTANPGMGEVPLFLSEWGASSCTTGDVNTSHKSAAWVAAFLPEALAQGVTMGSFLTIEDRLVYGGPAASSITNGASLLHTHGAAESYNFLPKPPMNVFRMYNLMTGLRNQVAVTPGSSGSHLGAFVTSDQNSTSAMVYNFDPHLVFNNDANTRTDTPENVSILISNIFQNNNYYGSVRVERYQIDATRSNLAYYLQHASDPTPPDPSLQKIEDYTGYVDIGELRLETPLDKPLGLGVTLYRITPR